MSVNPTPEELFARLSETPTDRLEFRTKDEMQKYRARLYTLNSGNEAYRLRTMAEGREMIVWKMRKPGGTIVRGARLG